MSLENKNPQTLKKDAKNNGTLSKNLQVKKEQKTFKALLKYPDAF